MKTMMKIVVAVAIVAMTYSASAASLIWRGNTTGFTDASSAVLANSYIVLLQGGNLSATPGLTVVGGVLTVDAGYSLLGATSLSGTGIVPTSTITITGDWTTGNFNVLNPPTGFPATVPTTGSGTGNARDYYMVVFDTSSLGTANKYAIVELATKNPTTPTGSLSLFFNGAQLNTWTAVPEPTSLALLALGAAAIGLRRKFRK